MTREEAERRFLERAAHLGIPKYSVLATTVGALYRVVVVHGEIVSIQRHPDFLQYADTEIEAEPIPASNPMLQECIKGFADHSDFYTIDIAQTTDGRHIVIEVGDGQVPDISDMTSIYPKLIPGI